MRCGARVLLWFHEPFPSRGHNRLLPARRRAHDVVVGRELFARSRRRVRPRGAVRVGEVHAFARVRPHAGARRRGAVLGRRAVLLVRAGAMAPPRVPCAAAAGARRRHRARQPAASLDAFRERGLGAAGRRRSRAPAGGGGLARRGARPQRGAAVGRPSRARRAAARVRHAAPGAAARRGGRRARRRVGSRGGAPDQIARRRSHGLSAHPTPRCRRRGLRTFSLRDGALSYASRADADGEGTRS